MAFVFDILHFVGAFERVSLLGDDRPTLAESGVDLSEVGPFFGEVFLGEDGFGGAFGDAQPAVDAGVGIDCKKVLSLMEAVHGAYSYAIGVFALDARFGDDMCHLGFLQSSGITM